MKQVAITGVRQATLVDLPDPCPLDNWVVVKVTIAPMCTEYKAWLAGHISQSLGHEAVGEVAAAARPCGVAVGDRVVVHPTWPCGRCKLCTAGDYIHCERMVNVTAYTGSDAGTATYCQYVIKPDWLCTPIPDDISDELAGLLLCGLGPSFGAFDRIALEAADTVVIAGLGPVGLGGVVNARFRGARVLAVESNAWRAALALELGAEVVLDPRDEATPGRLRELTAGRGASAALDCSGSPQAHRLLIDALGRLGRLAFVGESAGDTAIRVSPDMVRKGLTLRGSWHYNLTRYPAVVDVLRRSPVASRLISHTFPMSRVQNAFETLETQCTAKVLLQPFA